MNKLEVISFKNNEINEDYRRFYWYDCLSHINNRIVKAQEFLIKEYKQGLIDLDFIINLDNDYDALVNYYKDFGFVSEYEFKDLQRNHYILTDYLKKKGS